MVADSASLLIAYYQAEVDLSPILLSFELLDVPGADLVLGAIHLSNLHLHPTNFGALPSLPGLCVNLSRQAIDKNIECQVRRAILTGLTSCN